MKKLSIILITSLLVTPFVPVFGVNTTADKTTVIANAYSYASTKTVKVKSSADIYGSPTSNSKVIGHVHRGQTLTVTRKTTNGYTNIISNGASMGWVSIGALEFGLAQ